jgi:1-acyl-sn-glycerol-3-phosphate acyltransferase
VIPPDRSHDPRLTTLVRRLLTIPGYLTAAALVTVTLPLLLLLGVGLDLRRGQAGTGVRLVLFLFVYLLCEAAGILACGALWLRSLLPPRLEIARWQHLHYTLQLFWARALFESVRRLFRLRLEITGGEPSTKGPLLVFMRHASLVDTLLPAALLTGSHGLRLRYVLKRELLLDPCLDLAGNRLPNVFVRRNSSDSEREIAAVRRLAHALGPDDGVLIYPEGTRFTPAKRERILQRLAREGNAAGHARAQALRRVLPPRPGGALALLEAATDADVLFLAHTGLEGLANVSDLLGGWLIGRRIRVHLRRVPRNRIPEAADARLAWLQDEWERLDAWVDAELGDEPAGREAAAGAPA